MFGIGKIIGDSSAILKGIGGIVSGVKSPMAQAVGNMPAPDFSVLGPMLQKASYIAILHAAIEKAEKSPAFNLETQKNDLWIKLGNLSPQNLKQFELTQALLGASPQEQQQISQMLSNILKTLSESSKTIVNNMR